MLEKQDRVCLVKINHPEALNALNTVILQELDRAFDEIAADPETDVVILTGEGRSFVAGADIAEMSVMKAEEGRRFGELGAAVFRKIELMAKPVIAAVNGFALGGGCELAMACDIRIASAKAKFGQPEVGLGITPGFSGTQRLPRLVGLGKAKELIYTAAVIHAEVEFVGNLLLRTFFGAKPAARAYILFNVTRAALNGNLKVTHKAAYLGYLGV